MQSIQYQIDGEVVTVAFNPDWSGQALVLIGDRHITLPAALFVRMAKLINGIAIDEILDQL